MKLKKLTPFGIVAAGIAGGTTIIVMSPHTGTGLTIAIVALIAAVFTSE